jgi:hypothetical protein
MSAIPRKYSRVLVIPRGDATKENLKKVQFSRNMPPKKEVDLFLNENSEEGAKRMEIEFGDLGGLCKIHKMSLHVNGTEKNQIYSFIVGLLYNYKGSSEHTKKEIYEYLLGLKFESFPLGNIILEVCEEIGVILDEVLKKFL